VKTINSIFMDLAFSFLTAEDKALLTHPLIGGLILFTRHFKSYTQLQGLIAEVRAIRPDLIIAVDHEGGRVQRFRRDFSRIPPMAKLGKLYDCNPHLAQEAAYAIAYLMATELMAVGIDLNLGPVLDLDYQRNAAIGDRAFHAKSKAVASLGVAYLQGLKTAGMTAVAKHFPGHGYVAWDSHISLPVDERNFQTLYEQDMRPFRELIQHGLQAMMPSHILYKNVDSQITNFSAKWLKTILRKQLGFQGLVISDDLHMQATHTAGGMPARVFKALQAGCDIVLICNDRKGLIQTLQHLPQTSTIELSLLRSSATNRPDHFPTMERAKRWIRALS
jgi:beta-N-acetylhexosaminidase